MDQTVRPERHHIGFNLDPAETCRWIKERGYYAVIVGVNAYGAGEPGVAYGRPNQPAHIALRGQTLAWDGHTLTVEEP